MTDENLKINRSIEGDVNFSSSARIEQGTAVEFLTAIDDLLAADGVESVHWTQYIPYFNDGDPCEFTADEIYVKLEARFYDAAEFDEDDEDGYIEDRPGVFGAYSLYTYGALAGAEPLRYLDEAGTVTDVWSRQVNPEHEVWRKAYYDISNKVYEVNGQSSESIASALSSINLDRYEDVIRSNFGDHAQVTATPEGFSVEYYEHD